MSQTQVASYRGNCQRTGEYLDFGVPDLHSIAWRFRTQGAVESTPVVADGIVLFGSADGFFYAVQGQTGELLWQHKMQGQLTSPADVADGVVYFGGDGGTLCAVDLQTGQDRWTWDETCLPSEEELYDMALRSQGDSPEEIEEIKREFGDEISLPDWSFDTFTCPTVYQGQLYVLTTDTVLAFDPNTAKLLWCQPIGSHEWYLAVGDERVYTSSFCSPRSEGILFPLDAKTGVPRWPFWFPTRAETPYWTSYAEQLAVRNNLLYIGTYAGIYAIDVNQQKEIFYIPFKPSVASVDGLAIGQDIIYAAITGLERKTRSIEAYHRQGGELLWRYDPEQGSAPKEKYSSGYEMAPTLANGVLYLTRRDGSCIALDAATGQERWQIQIRRSIKAPPCITGQTVFVAAGNSVYALR